MLHRIVLLSLLCLFPTFALAGTQKHDEVKGLVINVSSDCTLVVLIDNLAEIIRLAGVAYPVEQKKNISDARNFVRTMVQNKNVRIQSLGRDPRGNIIGRIYHDKSCLNDTLIRTGLVQPAP